MKNFKILRKVMLLSLVLAMVVGAFAVNGFAAETAAAVSNAKNLLDGVTFDDYDGTTAAADYIYSKTGMFVSEGKDTACATLTVNGTPETGYSMGFTALNKVPYVDAKGSDGKFNQDKYNKNKDILDLFYSTTGPAKFSLSMDMTIQDNDNDPNNVGNFTKTSDDQQSLSSYYRGVSVLSFVGYKWMLKATTANLPTYNVDSDGYMVVNPDGVAENMKGKGYLYPNGQNTDIKVKAADDYSSLGGGTDAEKITCSSAIKSSYMTSSDVVTYTVGVPFNIELRFTRDTSTMSVQPYVNGKAFGGAVTYNLDTGTSTAGKAFGLRIFDHSPICDIDNIKVTITGCGEAHDGTANTHTGLWSTVNTVITNTPDSFNVKKVCMDSGIAFENYYVIDTIANEIKDVVVDKYTTGTLAINDTESIVNGSSDYWIAADINTRNGFVAPTSDTTLITVGGSPVLKLDTAGKLVMADGIAVGDALVAKNSYALALNIIPTETAGYYDCAVYIDGQLVGTAKNVSVGDSTVQLDAYNALRLLNIKAVKLGTAGDAVTVKSVAETEAMPCVGHAARPDTYAWYQNVTNAAKGINDLTFSYICDRCGERLYEKQGTSLYSTTSEKNVYFDGDGTWDVSTGASNKEIRYDKEVELTDGYWIAFDLGINSVDAAAVAAKGTGGGTLLKMNTLTDSILRLYSVADTDGNPETLDYELSELVTQGTDFGVTSGFNPKYILVADRKSSNANNKLAFLTAGDTYRVAIHSSHSAKNDTKIYINGKLVCSNGVSVSAFDDAAFRVKDGAYCAFDMSNFSFVNSVDTEYAPHVHSDEWSDGYTITNGYNTLDLTYTCYCGETASAGSVSEYVKLDSVYYGKAEIKDLPTTGDYWFTTNYYIATAEALAEAANVISVGDYSVLTAGELAPEVGKTYEIMVNVAYSAENAAVKVYVDNTLVKNVENVDLSALGSIVTLGDAAGTDVRFRYPKAVKLGDSTSRMFVEFNEVEEATKPCYHEGDIEGFVVAKGKAFDADQRIQAVNGLVKKYECTKCGEIIYEPQGDILNVDQTAVYHNEERYIELDATGSYIGNTYDGEGNTFNGHSYIVTNKASIGNKSAPFWISFDLKFDANSTQMENMETNKSAVGKNGGSFLALRAAKAHQFVQLIRGYAINNPEGGFYQDRYGIKLGSYVVPETGVDDKWVNAVLMMGKTYNVSVYIEVGASGCYKHTVYIDGKNIGSNEYTANASFGADDETYMLRFLDGDYGDFRISNFAFAKASAHEHKDKWSDHYIETGYNVLNEYYDCYCGETVKVGSLTDIVKNGLDNVYYGVGTVDGLPTTGDYWLTTNYYITNDDAVAEADSIISLGTCELLGADEIELKSKTTYQVAVNTVYTDEKVANVYVYVDGELVKSVSIDDVSKIGDVSVVTLGGGERNTDIRFQYTKAVKIGKDTPVNTNVTYTDAVDGIIKPCAHTPKADTYKWYKNLINTQKGIYDLVYSYVCDKCGEIVCSKQGASLYSTTHSSNNVFDGDGVFQIAADHGTSALYRDGSVALTHGFWVSFDIGVVNVNADNVAAKGTNGGTLFKMNETSNSILRLYTIKDTDGDTTTLDYELSQLVTFKTDFGVTEGYNTEYLLLGDRIGNNINNKMVILEEGKTYSIAIYSEYSTNNITKVYVDGKLLCTNGQSLASWGSVPLRFKDGGYGEFNISNFSFVNAVADHVHSDAWLDRNELAASKISMLADNKVGFEYQCYCGATVTAGIDEVLKDAVTPKYSVTEETVMLPVSEYDMSTVEKDFWLLTNVKVNNYPTSSAYHALISIGDTDLVSIDNAGNIMVGGVKTEEVLTNRAYMPVAIKFDVSTSTYYVYYERACIGKGTVDTLAADIKVAGGNSGDYHFDRMALVALAVDSNLCFVSGDDGHVHTALPEDTSLVFGDDKTTVQLTYTCSICERRVSEGIKTNLYDDPADEVVSTIPPVFGVTTPITTVSELVNSETPCWLSMYATLEGASSYAGDNVFAALVSAEGESIALLSLGVNGLVKDAAGHSVGTIGTAESNITISVVDVNGNYSIRYYLNGKYCATRGIKIDATKTYELVLGNDALATLSLTDIKLAELAAGANYAIGAYVCQDGHTLAVNSNTVIEYFDVNKFEVTYNCAKCGITTSDEAIASYYDSTPHIYEAEGEVGKDAVEGIDASAYWISVDVNFRTGTFGKFDGYVPLVSYNGTAYLLINSNGDLMLGDGTKLSARMPMYKITTYNVVLRYDTESGKLYAFIDGKYVGCSTDTVDEIGVQAANEREYFGAPALENIRYYNIKSVVTGAAPEEAVKFEFVEDLTYVPCAHTKTSQSVGIILKAGETIKEIYICDTCGERYTAHRDNDIFDPSLASRGGSNGISTTEFTVSSAKQIHSTGDIMSVESALGNEPYWVRFTVEVQKIIDGDDLVAQKGRAVTTGGVTFFGTANSASNYGHLLRLFPVAKPSGDYYEDRAVLRTGNSSNAKLVTTIYEGETYDFALRVIPANGVFQVYLDGEYVTTQKSSAIAAGKDKYYFRFLDGTWGTYKFSDFEFVAGAAHEHTPKYVPYMDGGYDVLAYGDATLTHRYTCYCGEEIVEGIDDDVIYLDAISAMKVSTQTAISSSAIAMGYKPYWISAKVHYGNSAAIIYSIDGTNLVETDGAVYSVGGVSTDVAPSLGDYDVVSVRVEPKSGEYYAYVNGAFIGSGKYDFGVGSDFDILLGGGSALEFTNIKLVSLAEGAEGTVLTCGDHAYTSGFLTIKSVALDSTRKIATLSCECKLCLEEVECPIPSTADITVTPVNDKGEAKDDYVLNDEVSFRVGNGPEDNKNFVYYALDKASVVDDTTPYYISFNVKLEEVASDLDLYNSGNGRNLINFGSSFASAIRVFPVEDGTDESGNPKYKTDSVELKSGNKDTPPIYLGTLTKKTDENPDAKDSANIVMRVTAPKVEIYVDGVLMATRTSKVMVATDNIIRFGDHFSSFTVSQLKVYREQEDGPTVDIAAIPCNDKGDAKDSYTFIHNTTINVGDDIHVDNAQTFVYYAFDKASVVDDKTPYWFSFDVKFNDVPYSKEGDNDPVPDPASLYNNNGGMNLMNFHSNFKSPVRVFPVVDSTDGDGNPTYKTNSVELKTGRKDAALPLITLEKGDSTNITMRVDISGETPVLDIFVDGELKATRTDSFIDVTQNMIRLGDYCGSFTISNMRLYRAEIAAPVAETFEQPKLHMPTSTNPGTIIYGEDGSLKHEFVCATCTGKTHTYDCANELQKASLNNGKIVTELLGVTSERTIEVSESIISTNGVPYWLFVDITADSVNTAAVQNKGSGGASILALKREYDTDGDGKIAATECQYIQLLRAYYRNDKVVLDSSTDTGSTLERELVAGKTLRYAFAVDPTTGMILFYIDGVLCGNASTGGRSLPADGDEYAIRFTDGNYGNFNFTNIKFVQLTDQCHHDVSCLEGATYECGDCEMTVPAAHNYVATLDATKMWTKYTCEDCGKYYIEFNDKSLLVDEDDNELTFATNALLIEYLTKNYMPVFPTKEIVE